MKKIQIDHYESAYGRTIRIFTRDMQALNFMKELFERLSIENDLEVDILDLYKNAEVTGLQSLKLKQVHSEPALGGHLLMNNKFQFIWSRSKEGWKECAELVDGIISSGTDGHQYLTSEDYDDALVVVSFANQ